MNLRFFIILVLIFLVGCSNNQITGQVVAPTKGECEAPYLSVNDICCLDENDNRMCDTDEEALIESLRPESPSCPESCDDSNPCTEDRCSELTQYECVNTAIVPCCGNNLCEEDEEFMSCPKDCDISPSIGDLQVEVKNILGREQFIFNSKESGTFKIYSNPGIRATITEITSRSAYYFSSDAFKSLVESQTQTTYDNLKKSGVITCDNCDVELRDEEVVSEGKEFIQSSIIVKHYNTFVGGLRVFDNLQLFSVIQVPCAPHVIVAVDRDPGFDISQSFTGLSEEEIDDTIDEFVLNVRETSLSPASRIADYCFASSGISFS